MIWMEGRPPPSAHDCEINIKFHIPRAAPTILLQGGAVCLFTVKDIAPSAFTIFLPPSSWFDRVKEYSTPSHHQTRENWTVSGNVNKSSQNLDDEVFNELSYQILAHLSAWHLSAIKMGVY